MHSHLVWVTPRRRTWNNQLSLPSVNSERLFCPPGHCQASEVPAFSFLLRADSPFAREAAAVSQHGISPPKLSQGHWTLTWESFWLMGSLLPSFFPPDSSPTPSWCAALHWPGPLLTSTSHCPSRARASQGDQQALWNGPVLWPKYA